MSFLLQRYLEETGAGHEGVQLSQGTWNLLETDHMSNLQQVLYKSIGWD